MVPPFYSVGLVSVFATERDQRVGDLVAATVVVRERESSTSLRGGLRFSSFGRGATAILRPGEFYSRR